MSRSLTAVVQFALIVPAALFLLALPMGAFFIGGTVLLGARDTFARARRAP